MIFFDKIFNRCTFLITTSLLIASMTSLKGFASLSTSSIKKNKERYLNQHLRYLSERTPIKFSNLFNDTRIKFDNFKKPLQKNTKLNSRHKKQSIIHGKYSKLFNTIYINPNLFDESPSGTLSKKLLKVLVHEFAHVYEKKVDQISKDIKYQILAGYNKQGLLFKRLKVRNKNNVRSPDTYEFSNIQESLAVNLEYFILDPNYRCSRPQIYRYLAKKLNFTPYTYRKNGSIYFRYGCKTTKELPYFIKNQVRWIEFNPNQLYQVHYFQASKGKQIASRFGHSMIRLVFCNPDKNPVPNPACLNDLKYHFILSYRANISDIKLNPIKAVLGNYNSQVYIFPLTEVINEYNKTELRDLYSFPVGLSKSELNNVIPRLLEEVWSYSGKYKFLSQNCAHETLTFFKSISNNKNLLTQYATTPNGVLRVLDKSGLTNKNYFNELSEEEINEKNLKFYSYEGRYKNSFKNLPEFIREKYDFEGYIHKTTSDDRKELIESIIMSEYTVNTISSLWTLENYIQESIYKKILKQLVNSKNKKNSSQYLLASSQLQEKINKIKSKSYGIPRISEVNLIKDYILKRQKTNMTKMKNFISTKYETLNSELTKSRENGEFLLNHLINDSYQK